MLSGIFLDDVVVSILSRLPVKSLVRFKAVSKPWYQLIESSQFITEHFQTRAATSNNGCLFIKEKKRSNFSLVYSHSPTWKGLEDLHGYDGSNTIDSHCNGIFCVFAERNTVDCYAVVQLWNPALRQTITLPRSLIRDFDIPADFYRASKSNLGLCFDPKCNTYKVVRIWSFRRRLRTPGPFCMNKVEVWSPGKDTWRQIEIEPHIQVTYYFSQSINLKGKCYWVARYSLESDVIVSFDMVLEVFRMAPLPDVECFSPGRDSRYVRLAILKESIAALSKPLQHDPNCFEIWLMNGSEQMTWSKYLKVEKPSPGPIPRYLQNPQRKRELRNPKIYHLGIWNNGELVFRDEYERLVFFNMSTRETNYTGFRVYFEDRVYLYNESLVSINEWLE